MMNTTPDPAVWIPQAIRYTAHVAAARIAAGDPVDDVTAYLTTRTHRIAAVAGELPAAMPTLEQAWARHLDAVILHTAILGGHRRN